jgi:hypothetical protein
MSNKRVTIAAPPQAKEKVPPPQPAKEKEPAEPEDDEEGDDGGLPPLSKEDVGRHEIFKNLDNAIKFYCRKNNLKSDAQYREHLLSYFYACHYCPTFFG